MERRTFLSLLIAGAAAPLARFFVPGAAAPLARFFVPWPPRLAPTPALLPPEFYDVVSTSLLVQPEPQYCGIAFELLRKTRGCCYRTREIAGALLRHECRRHELGRRDLAPTVNEVICRAKRLG
jgi:hypothetical protein